MSKINFSINSLNAVNQEIADPKYYIHPEDLQLFSEKLEYSFKVFTLKDDLVEVFVHLRKYLFDENRNIAFDIIHFDIVTVFFIKEYEELIKKKNGVSYFPINFLEVLLAISISNTRGYIKGKINDFLFPIILPKEEIMKNTDDILDNKYYKLAEKSYLNVDGNLEEE